VTEEQIIEGNKIIADYMGWGISGSGPLTWYETGDKNIDSPLVDELKFHTDWNWLMPVIKRCCDDLNHMGFDKRGSWTPQLGYVSEIYVMRLNSPIEKVWQEVINHINRYKK